ncbi:hypothetical protein HMSSN036_79780 [Paenibacillus macerans]|nr:hypothetical protein HMSSN036_79780 [Paenibacillus macerans]
MTISCIFPIAVRGNRVAVFPDFVARAVIAASAAIEHYRFVQLAGGELDISLQLAADSSRATLRPK